MNELEETIYINRLLDIYGRLLTDAQLEIMQDYYQLNLSLSEISENREITRAAVNDAIKKAKEKLANYEEKLGICRVLDNSKEGKTPSEIDLINSMEEQIKNGI